MKKLLLACFLILGVSASADTVKRTVNSQGEATITIHGNAAPEPLESRPAKPGKEFKVYELDGEGAPPPAQEPSSPQIVIIPSPPPIAPNPAAYGYGYYGYGFGYDDPYWGGPGYPLPYCGPGIQRVGGPLNYQNPPVNYQSPPVNYQPRPINAQGSIPNGRYCPPVYRR